MVRVLHLTKIVKLLVLESTHWSLQLRSIAVPHRIMEKTIIRYEGNGTTKREYLHFAGELKRPITPW